MKIEVAFSVIDRKGNIIVKRKVFRNREQAEKYLSRLDEKGTLFEVLGYCTD